MIIKILAVFAFLLSTNGTDRVASLNAFLVAWLAVPASLPELIARPYTLITYMFLHFDFLHILFNMLWLFWFGQIFLQYLNQRQLVFTYITGGVAGASLYILFYNIFPAFAQDLATAVALGASASVLAVVVAISFWVPNYTMHLLFIGPVRIKYIALATVIIDFFMIRSGNAGGHIAHLGGAFWGWVFILLMRSKQIDLSAYLSLRPLARFRNLFTLRKKAKFRNIYYSDRPLTDEEYNQQKADLQKKTDKILDKIKHSGYESLTREEKEFLFDRSRK